MQVPADPERSQARQVPLHVLVQHTSSTQVSDWHWPLTVHGSPGSKSSRQRVLSQCAATSQSPSPVHELAHSAAWFAGCVCAPVQNTAGYGPQALASSPEQPESSATDWPPQVKFWQMASCRVPWQVDGESQVEGRLYAPHCADVVQQSPLAQQTPWLQWLLSHCASREHDPPSA